MYNRNERGRAARRETQSRRSWAWAFNYGLREPFTGQQESYLVRTREFVDDEVLQVNNGCWERAEFP